MTISVSIIIPCYNSRWTMETLCLSLAPYLRDDVEIIFVDDGSNDGSGERFQQLLPQAKYVRQENAGVAAARNHGFRLSKGKFIQLLDADDTLEPGKFEKQLEAATRENLEVVYSDWRMIIVEDDIVNEPIMSAKAPAESVEALLGGWWVTTNAYLIRRDAYEQLGGFDEDLENLEDFDFWLRLALAGKRFGHVPGYFANYYRYMHVQSRGRGPRREYWASMELIIGRVLEALEARGQLTAPRRDAAARQLHYLARNVFDLDRAWFDRVIDRIYELDPKFNPGGTWSYRTAARYVGLARAETISSLTRALRGRGVANRT